MLENEVFTIGLEANGKHAQKFGFSVKTLLCLPILYQEFYSNKHKK